MTRLTHLLSAMTLVPSLSLIGGAGDKSKEETLIASSALHRKAPVPKSDNGKEDALIAAMKFVKVHKGTFWMGWESNGKESKQVEIKDDFQLAAYTVKQEQWQAVMGNNPSCYSRTGTRYGKEHVKDIADADLKRFPVENVSWDDVQEFLKKLNEREKGTGWLYRLPSEAEWEYACRNATTSKEDGAFDYYFDKPTSDLCSKQANFHGDFPAGKAEKGPWLQRTTKVGAYAPNKLGLYDMHGNVCQWCSDSLETEPRSVRMTRGGGFDCTGEQCQAAYRLWCKNSERKDNLGFRLARTPSESK